MLLFKLLNRAVHKFHVQQFGPAMVGTVCVLLRKLVPIDGLGASGILAAAGATTLFEARAFQDLCYEAEVAVESSTLLNK
jgi:hypothetical protein